MVHAPFVTLCVSALVIFAGCASRDPGAAAGEASVRPGINQPYRENPAPDAWTERFEREGREVYDCREEIVKTCGLRSGNVVADIGAGTGLFTEMFSPAVGGDGRVIAVDIVPEFLSGISERAAKKTLSNVETHLCSENALHLPGASIDVAFVCDTYHHFEYPAAMLRSIHAALRSGGRLLIVDFERIEGVSPQWVLDHVRAGREAVLGEIEAAGFVLLGAHDAGCLKENYFAEFRKR